ncbi:AAA family ATPase [Acinetobacter sp. YH12145]|uniref:AAA family ATPase n=1 Tax=Acinetobacter sp. YH12145 TaxID=2601129 RepID=UPI0015D250F4|nr:AAA family ATPase [Acinetobacter sp. YH12145]
MITNYSIENFKIFSDKTDLKFAPITLIYGPNSSGKSSIIQSLLVLKESLLSSNSLKSNNQYFELGSYLSVVNEHNSDKKIGFQIDVDELEYSFEYAYSKEHNISFLDKTELISKEDSDFNFLFRPKSVSRQGVHLYNFDFDKKIIDKLVKQNRLLKDISEIIKEKHPISNNEIERHVKKVSFSRKNNLLPLRISRPDVDASGLLNDDETQRLIHYYQNTFVEDISKYLNRSDRKLFNLLSNVSYIGPLRPHPKRVYQLDGLVNNSVGQKGENFLSFLTQEEKYIEGVNKVLEDFGINYIIEIKRLNDEIIGDTASILLKNKSNGVKTTLVDVGFGIGQVLPIIIEGLVKEKASICIEQPEIHLHPKLQANLANFFAKDIKSSKANQWIIETHSEALLLRFQRLIRHKVLMPQDISIIYVNPAEDDIRTIEIPLDADGDFKVTWPNGFFEERLDEMFGGNPLEDEKL